MVILIELVKLVKGGYYVGGIGWFLKIVFVGYGFGSVILFEVVRKNRKLVDGVVLIGRFCLKIVFFLYEEMGG